MNRNTDLKELVTIVMPVYNGASTLNAVFKSLESQNFKEIIAQVLFINDTSQDNSINIIEQYMAESSYSCKLISNSKNLGLAGNYNEGVMKSKSKFVLTMHQDMILQDKNSFKKVVTPLLADDNAIVSFPVIVHPRKIWESYNFWQKALFDRYQGRKNSVMTGKFDCFSKKLLLELGLFDDKHFRSAGEDGDLNRRIEKSKHAKCANGVEVFHLHNQEKNFGSRKYIKKEAQIAEAQGALLRIHGIGSIKSFLLTFFRQAIFIGIFIPFLNIFFIFILLAYSYHYTKNLYHEKYPFMMKLQLFVMNIYILPVTFFYGLKGFYTGREQL